MGAVVAAWLTCCLIVGKAEKGSEEAKEVERRQVFEEEALRPQLRGAILVTRSSLARVVTARYVTSRVSPA